MEKVNSILFLFIVWLRADSVMVPDRAFLLDIPKYMLLRDMHGNGARSK